jgi:hypothetical protein
MTWHLMMAVAIIAVAAAVALSAGTAPAPATRPTTQPTTTRAAQGVPVPDEAEVRRLVRQLDDDNYATREAATAKLSGMAAAGIAVLEKVLGDTRLTPEMEARGMMALRRVRRNGTMTFMFEGAPVDTILAEMTKHYGMIIIQPSPMRMPVTVQNPNVLDAKQAIVLLNDILFQFGYTGVVTTTPDGDIVVRILTWIKAKKAQMPVFVGADPEKIPLNETLITQVIPLILIPAGELRQELGGGMDVDVTSNSLIVTDTSAKIHRLVQIIRKLDEQKAATQQASATRPEVRPAENPRPK